MTIAARISAEDREDLKKGFNPWASDRSEVDRDMRIIEATLGKALFRGLVETATPGRWSWNIAGRCQRPVPFRRKATAARQGRKDNKEIIMVTRCRQCTECMKYRAREWRARAQAEIAASPVTFFGTLTLRSQEHVVALAEASRKADEDGLILSQCSEGTVFRMRTAVVGTWTTKWLKRVRKELAPLRLRYLLVAEAHKSGLPHLHALIHCVAPPDDAYDVYRVLKCQWTHGHSDFSGVAFDRRTAGYVCKYLTKSALARVRASALYGDSGALTRP